jgi:hypothetical protein
MVGHSAGAAPDTTDAPRAGFKVIASAVADRRAQNPGAVDLDHPHAVAANWCQVPPPGPARSAGVAGTDSHGRMDPPNIRLRCNG